MKKHVFLIGFMGSGKSFWGQLLAKALQRPFVDLDELIEKKAGKKIAEIFAATDEGWFRELEQCRLHELDAVPAAIVATGGGTPCFFDNMARMKKTGTTIYLKTPPEILIERLKNEINQRPLLKNAGYAGLPELIKKRIAEREAWYLQADLVLEYEGDDDVFLQQLIEAVDADG